MPAIHHDRRRYHDPEDTSLAAAQDRAEHLQELADIRHDERRDRQAEHSIKTRPAAAVLQANGQRRPRKMHPKTCSICGAPFLGRAEAKSCSPACTLQLRSQSAANRP